jgi:hypothetical protein
VRIKSNSPAIPVPLSAPYGRQYDSGRRGMLGRIKSAPDRRDADYTDSSSENSMERIALPIKGALDRMEKRPPPLVHFEDPEARTRKTVPVPLRAQSAPIQIPRLSSSGDARRQKYGPLIISETRKPTGRNARYRFQTAAMIVTMKPSHPVRTSS